MGLFKKKSEKYKISSYDQNQVKNQSRMTAFDKIKYESDALIFTIKTLPS